jgi:hypothetical protein
MSVDCPITEPVGWVLLGFDEGNASVEIGSGNGSMDTRSAPSDDNQVVVSGHWSFFNSFEF